MVVNRERLAWVQGQVLARPEFVDAQTLIKLCSLIPYRLPSCFASFTLQGHPSRAENIDHTAVAFPARQRKVFVSLSLSFPLLSSVYFNFRLELGEKLD